jgi:hypothetical protein
MVEGKTITLDEETDARFRVCIGKAYPQKRGNRKRAALEAVNDWCDKIEKRS